MRKTKLKILSTLILTSLLTFISCNNDDLHNHNHERKVGINSRKITFNEFKKHTKAFNVVSEVNRKQSETNNALNKIVKDTINNFTIDTQEGLYLQYANLHSFTFPIQRHVDNGKIENLVLSYQNDGSYKVKILQYDLTPQEKADLELDQLKTIQNPIVTIPIENFDTNLVVNGCETYTELVVIPCSQGVHDAYNLGDWWQCTAQTPGRVYAVSRIRCLVDIGGSNGGGDPLDGGFGDSTGGGATDGDNNYPPEYPTPQTDPEDYEEGISAPVKPSLSAPKTPCNELMKLNSNNSIQQTLRILKGQSSGVAERGNYISETTNSAGATYLSFPVIPQNPNKPNEIDINAGLATGKVKGAMHCHNNPATTGMFPMFSAADLGALYGIAYFHIPTNNTTKDYAEYTVMLSVGSGHYALKLKNFSGDYNAKFNANIVDFQKELEKDNEKLTATATSSDLIKAFLEKLNYYFGDEVGLYKATESTDANGLPKVSGWKEQTLNENGDIVEINCQ